MNIRLELQTGDLEFPATREGLTQALESTPAVTVVGAASITVNTADGEEVDDDTVRRFQMIIIKASRFLESVTPARLVPHGFTRGEPSVFRFNVNEAPVAYIITTIWTLANGLRWCMLPDRVTLTTNPMSRATAEAIFFRVDPETLKRVPRAPRVNDTIDPDESEGEMTYPEE